LTEYRTGAGGHIRVTSILGKGGEGKVFCIDGNNDTVAKIYTDGRHGQRQQKIVNMVAAGLHRQSTLVAFPADTLLTKRGEFVGFTMRKVVGFKPIHELYSPGSRKIEFPNTDFRRLARTATNVARAIASVHQNRCVVGDINHSGILVNAQAMVTLIDSDSFQFSSGSTVFRCLVGTDEYTPPELRRSSLDKVDRYPSHDAFGLAVILFQILFLGKQPYAGRYSGPGEMSIARAIQEGRFAYSVKRRDETRMDPPPFAPTLGELTPELALMFEQAFSSNPLLFPRRPSAADWVHSLGRFEAELVVCRANPSHHHPKNAASCPWCRLEKGMGVALFPQTGARAYSTAPSSFDLRAAMAAIGKVTSPGPAPDPTGLISLPPVLAFSPAALQVKRSRRYRLGLGFGIAAFCVALLFYGIPIAILGIALAGYIVFGMEDGTQELQHKKAQATREWLSARAEWEREVGPDIFERKRAALSTLSNDYRRLPEIENSKIAELDRRRRQIQLQRFLEGHLIARVKISGIGDGRKATLASYGIEDAWDITDRKIRGVPGFGDAMSSKLLEWRMSVERKFVFNPALGTDTTAIQQVKDEIARRRLDVERSLSRGPIELEQIRTRLIAARNRPTERLIEVYRSLKQAEFDTL